MKSQFKIMQLDFKETWNKELAKEIEKTDVFIAADGKQEIIETLNIFIYTSCIEYLGNSFQ